MEPSELYGLPLDEFIDARKALAKELRADGGREEAAAVAALRKPTVAAWAVNQLVRSQAKDVRALLKAGDGLAAAQEALLAGKGDGRKLQAAGEKERAALDALVDAAGGLLSSSGAELSDAVLERIRETLHAAAVDATAREAVESGMLLKELAHAGLGLGEAPMTADVPAAPSKKKPAAAAPAKAKKDAAKAEKAAKAAAERERKAAEKLEAERKEARTALRDAEKVVDRTARAVRSAQQARDRAAKALEAADSALDDAVADAERAEKEAAKAQKAVEKLED